MCVELERFQVAHSVMAGACFEYVAKRERAESRVPAGAATVNHQPISINPALRRQKLRAINAIIDIDNAPTSIEPLAIRAAIPGASAIVHIEHGKTPAGPILNAQHQRGDRCRSRSAVALYQ